MLISTHEKLQIARELLPDLEFIMGQDPAPCFLIGHDQCWGLVVPEVWHSAQRVPGAVTHCSDGCRTIFPPLLPSCVLTEHKFVTYLREHKALIASLGSFVSGRWNKVFAYTLPKLNDKFCGAVRVFFILFCIPLVLGMVPCVWLMPKTIWGTVIPRLRTPHVLDSPGQE